MTVLGSRKAAVAVKCYMAIHCWLYHVLYNVRHINYEISLAKVIPSTICIRIVVSEGHAFFL